MKKQHVLSVPTLVLACLASQWLSAAPAQALDPVELQPTRGSATSQRSAATPHTAAWDNDPTTYWSSAVQSDRYPTQLPSLTFGWGGKRMINYLRVLPRRVNGVPVAYPDSVELKWADTSSGTWVWHKVVNSGLRTGADWYTFRFPYPVVTDSVMFSASGLGTDETNQYAVQIAEIRVGYTGDEPAVPTTLGKAINVGSELASGDFNRDGYLDLAVGVPGQQVGDVEWAGTVQIYYGSAQGLSAAQVFSKDSPGVLEAPQTMDLFGQVLASGDFDGDLFSDLAISAGSNQVQVLYGSANGLTSQRAQLLMQGLAGLDDVPEQQDSFGNALAAGDFNCDGRSDLAIGVSHEDVSGKENVGAVAVIYGSSTGLSAMVRSDDLWTQDSPDIEGVNEPWGKFGASLAAGDFNGDRCADLAIGSPGEDIGALADGGCVNVIYGSPARSNQVGGLSATYIPDQIWYQDFPSAMPDVSQAKDFFGDEVAAGDLNGDGYADLAIGVPGQAMNGAASAGAVHIVYGSGGGLNVASNQFFGHASPTSGNMFGENLAIGNFNGDTRRVSSTSLEYPIGDLAIGIGRRNVSGLARAGVVNLIHGSATGLLTATVKEWSLNTAGVPDDAAESDVFGSAVATGDFNNDGASDLAIGAPEKRGPWSGSATGMFTTPKGTFTTLYGVRNTGLTASGSTTIHQRHCEYMVEPQDCMDLDQDGVPTGVERLAGLIGPNETDAPGGPASRDFDLDGIPDSVEIRTVLSDGQGNYRVDTRSDPKVDSVYAVLLHAPGVSGFDPSTLRANLEAYFAAADPRALNVKVFTQAVDPNNVAALNASCRQTMQSEGLAPQAQQGWLSESFGTGGVSNLLAGIATDATQAAPYAHVGRICLDTNAATPLKGAIQYIGGWQFMVNMRAPTAGRTPNAEWHRALASVAAHELGHSLGLGHGGSNDDDCNPLYPSVMNHAYDFQLASSGVCSTLGFSAGRLAPPGQNVMSIDLDTSEFDVLNGVYRKKISSTDDGKVRASDLNFLSCWANGDFGGPEDTTPLGKPTVALCEGSTTQYCANWDQDSVAGRMANPDQQGEYFYDGLYGNSSIFDARRGRGRLEAIVSGCSEADLNPDGEDPPPLPGDALTDHDDFGFMLRNLATVSRTHCNSGVCEGHTEPQSAFIIDALRNWW